MGVGGLGQSADSSEVDQSSLVPEEMWDHLLETLRERAVGGDLGFPKGKCPRPQGCPSVSLAEVCSQSSRQALHCKA